MTLRVRGLVGGLLIAVTVSGCGGGSGSPSSNTPPPAPLTYSATSGVAQKGPLILGATVTAQELSSALAPTGKQYSYQTTSDFGQFNPNSTFTSQYIGVNATGYYYDESAGAVSTGPITLNSYSDLSASTVLNVNLLTTLAYLRVQNLVANSHLAFAAAQNQAEREVLAALNIRNAGTLGHFDSLDISKTTDGDRILAAISALFTQGNTSANLAMLIANVQSDIGANGQITSNATRTLLAASANTMNPAMVAANLTQRYSSLGLVFSAADIGNWIDNDGDGVVGKFEFKVSDAGPSSTFTFPSNLTNPSAGTSVSVSVGRMTVNGTAVTGAATIQSGDVVAVMPPTGPFPSGMLTTYLMSGATRIAKVSFVNGLVSIAVTPADPMVPVGLQQQLTATGTFTDGGTADLTTAVTWSSSLQASAAISAGGLVSGITPGLSTITAQSGSVSGFTSLNVLAAALTSITIAPNPVSVGVGIQRQLTATGHYSDGTSANLTPTATWSIGSTATATVTGGLVTGVALGSTTVTASSGSTSGNGTVDVSSSHWTAVPGMGGREGHTVTLLPNGKVFLAFGRGAGSCCLSDSQIYDPATNNWSPGPQIGNGGVWLHAAALLANGKVMVTGGADGTGATTNLHTFLYDPVSNTMTEGAPLSSYRYSARAVTLPNGKVLLVGAGGVAGPDLYDPVTDSWSAAAPQTQSAYSPSATLLPGGKVLVAGGWFGTVSNPLSVAEIYDPATNTWSSAGHMTQERMNHAAVLLPTGKVLVTGGTGVSGDVTTAEIYDPAGNSWAPAASMSHARHHHVAGLLPNGKVLVAGGYSSAAPASAELYDPAADSWSAAPDMLGRSDVPEGVVLPNGAMVVFGGLYGDYEVYW